MILLKKKKKKYGQKNRKRKIIFFNPPFCWLASINVDKYILKLIDEHFKHDYMLYFDPSHRPKNTIPR